MVSLSSLEKDFIATTRYSFKDFILAYKISNQMHANFEKRKVPQAISGNFAQKWLFCKTCSLQYLFLYLWQKFEKHVLYLVGYGSK